MTALEANAVRLPALGDLPLAAIWADCGHPQWPGWQWLAALVAVSVLAATVTADQGAAMLRARRAEVIRIEAIDPDEDERTPQ